MTTLLPRHHRLNVNALNGLFNSTTNSYKYLFFLALLEILQERQANNNPDRRIALWELAIRLLQLGWYPHRFFRLSFGASDQIGQTLDRLEFSLSEAAVTSPKARTALHSALTEQYDGIGADALLRYVPYRLLTPFFPERLKASSDAQRNRYIVAAANDTFSSDSPPLYRFLGEGFGVEIHPDWWQYLEQNLGIVRGWALYEWANYLQKRNPNAPAVLHKLEPPVKRESLRGQARFWDRILAAQPQTCLYSGTSLSPGHYHLDHFLPWSFVCHNDLWNLIPANPTANLSKGRTLPGPDTLNRFIERQGNALRIFHTIATPDEWRSTVDDYITGLDIPEDGLLDPIRLEESYRSRMEPLTALARSLGY